MGAWGVCVEPLCCPDWAESERKKEGRTSSTRGPMTNLLQIFELIVTTWRHLCAIVPRRSTMGGEMNLPETNLRDRYENFRRTRHYTGQP
jgi:hypothetical protein